MLKVWGRRSAFNVQKAMWAIGELGLQHQHTDAGGNAGGLDAPAFREMNPHGRIPVIDDGGLMVWESNSIIRYLGAKYGVGHLWDADPAERSLADRWMDWGLANAQRDFLDLFWGYYRTPADRRDPDYVAERFKRCARNYQLLDRHLETQPFLAGERFSMADIPAGTTLFRYFEMDIERPDVPNVEAWYARLRQRPAYQEHVMLPFEDLFGRLAY
ncbi:MAG: glutathione S-transferase [Proteobacteria bacterium]|nr:glutathione S-transferase [Pseudomonadota bacterium]